MTTIDLIPTEEPKPEISQQPDVSEAPAENVEHQSIDVSEHKQSPDSPEEVTTETRQEESGVQPTARRKKGRPPGSKNKEPRKRSVKLEPVQAEPLEPVKEEEPVIEKTKPTPDLSPVSHRRQMMQAMALKRREQQQAKIAHYTSLLDKRLGF